MLIFLKHNAKYKLPKYLRPQTRMAVGIPSVETTIVSFNLLIDLHPSMNGLEGDLGIKLNLRTG